MHSKKIIDAICQALISDTSLYDITVISEFPSVKQDVPLQRSVVSVGLEAIEITGTDNELPVSANASPIYYKFGLMLCVPKAGTGTVCHDAVDRILKSLKATVSDYSVTEIKVGQMKYSSALGALTVLITVTVFNGNAY